MKLYCFMVAPNPTKVRLYLAEKAAGGCSMPVEEVEVSLIEGEQRKAEHLARNPAGTLPVLELDDGTYLTESLSIIEYLEDLYPDPPMFGADALSRARGRELERKVETGILNNVGHLVHTTKSPLGLPANPPVADYFRARLDAQLDRFNESLSDGRPFLLGDAVSVADCTLAAALQFARFAGIDAVASHPEIARWDNAYRARPVAAGVIVA